MNWNWKEYRKEKSLFRSYYCAGCRQQKPCGVLTSWNSEWKSYCCACYYEREQEKAQEYSSYEKVLESKREEKLAKNKQLELLKDYSGCPQCGSKEVDAYSLYENSKLVCQPCRMKKEGGASGSINFLERQKWFKKYWKVDLVDWLENYGCLPVNSNCADKWLKDKEHLKSCDCSEREVKNLVDLFTGSLQRYREKLKKCKCEKSEKIRVDSDNYAWCERCQEPISAASKKRVIKNRNDPRFWGLEVKEKVLCLECLGKLAEKMPKRKRYLLGEYLKRYEKRQGF